MQETSSGGYTTRIQMMIHSNVHCRSTPFGAPSSPNDWPWKSAAHHLLRRPATSYIPFDQQQPGPITPIKRTEIQPRPRRPLSSSTIFLARSRATGCSPPFDQQQWLGSSRSIQITKPLSTCSSPSCNEKFDFRSMAAIEDPSQAAVDQQIRDPAITQIQATQVTIDGVVSISFKLWVSEPNSKHSSAQIQCSISTIHHQRPPAIRPQ
ncbi:hypothetical protein ACLOJK_027236 [Asimina triloba]